MTLPDPDDIVILPWHIRFGMAVGRITALALCGSLIAACAVGRFEQTALALALFLAVNVASRRVRGHPWVIALWFFLTWATIAVLDAIVVSRLIEAM